MDVCGLKWDPTGDKLASGGSDKIMSLFCLRTRKGIFRTTCQGAIRALEWCPKNPSFLLLGEGVENSRIRIINTQTLSQSYRVKVDSQVCGLIHSKYSDEMVSLHNDDSDQIKVWNSSIHLG